MKKLEGMAAELFLKFSIQETGKAANWVYLSKERKIEWMKDVLVMANHFLETLQSEFKPWGKIQGQTVYEAALIEGARAERISNQQTIEQIYKDLNDELEEFLKSK